VADNSFKIIVISSSKPIINESKIITDLFNSGLELFHLRKPLDIIKDTEQILFNIPKEFHNRIVIHQHYQLLEQFELKGIHIKSKMTTPLYNYISTSCHSLAELSNKNNYEYVFISPIFNSISKYGYNSNFSINELKEAQSKEIIDNKVIALGGIVPNNIGIVRDLGFGGAAVLGYLWGK
jgi:thiamine-phosphate pyrophosphorylase